MSYLAEVLSSVEKIELEQINAKCPELAATVEVCKNNVLTFLENIYVRFTERPKQNKILALKLNQLQDEATSLINNMDEVLKRDLNKTETDVKKHLESITKATFTLNVMSSLCQIHEALIQIKKLREAQSYLLCMKKIKETDDVINNTTPDEMLQVLEELGLVVDTEKMSLLNKLSNVFKENVIVKPVENRSVVKIKNENDVLKEILLALYFYRTSVAPLDYVTKFLWNHVFTPVVDYTVEIKTNVDDYAVMEIITVDPNKKSSYAEVFANIKTILNFLSANFNISLTDDLSTLSYIGRDIRDNLSELIIKHCLQDTIPSTVEGLQQYKVVIEATEDLEKALVISQIFAKDTISILEYANNIDVLFINKKCQDYLQLAQTYMKKDLHDLVEVGESQGNNSLEITNSFPLCSVSRGVLDLLQLLEKILSETVTSSDMSAGRLLYTAKNICLLYTTFIPEHHKKLLQTIPQQIAVFYNNCIYITHNLVKWNNTYLTKLPLVLEMDLKSFTYEGHQLQEVASQMFATYVDSQIKQIREIMNDAGLQRPTLEQLDASTEKCLRQCLRQQELLRTVWHKVLPYTMYNKTLGAILNSLCNYIVNAIVKCEDISSDAAEQLVELFKMVQTRGPKLFTDPKEVTLFVSSWYKLSEMVFVLNANLSDINDRWADGKGPLALQFKAEKLKQLIRALFQNTERRAALLAKIHD